MFFLSTIFNIFILYFIPFTILTLLILYLNTYLPVTFYIINSSEDCLIFYVNSWIFLVYNYFFILVYIFHFIIIVLL